MTVATTSGNPSALDRRRRITDVVMRSLCVAATLLAIIPLVAILIYVAAKGVGGLSWHFFTEVQAPAGETGGGMANAIVGTLVLVALACAIGIPVGVMTGIYLAEIGRDSTFARTVRFCADVMSGVPSIVVGIFIYMLIVQADGTATRRWPAVSRCR